ncbi:hypothetical protein TCAL_04698, partial [Tigriopus californicus]
LWKKVNIPSFGNCFIFNSAFNETDQTQSRNATLTGAANGMSLQLFLDQDSYMLKGLSQQAGVRLIIHNPATYPLADEYGIDLQPNTANSIAIQMNKISRLPEPHPSNCITNWEQTGMNQSLMIETKPTYSLGACYRHCFQLDVIRECSCYHTYLDMSLIDLKAIPFKDGNGSRPCSLIPDQETNPDFECFDAIFNDHDRGVRKCHKCLVSCE